MNPHTGVEHPEAIEAEDEGWHAGVGHACAIGRVCIETLGC